MGRLLQGFGVGVISYMVCNKVPSLRDYSVPRMFMTLCFKILSTSQLVQKCSETREQLICQYTGCRMVYVFFGKDGALFIPTHPYQN